MRVLFLPALLLTTLGAAAPYRADVPAPVETARRWGVTGHRVVARVAAARLSRPVAETVRRLLGGQTMAAVSSWADSVRRDRANTGPWHFVDIPTWEPGYDAARDCKNGACIVVALDQQLAILRDRKRSDADRGEALRFVIHFLGDMHQPLHAGERGDKGGNDVKLTWLGKPSNLHSLWDSGLIGASGLSEEEYVAMLQQRLATRGDLARITGGTVIDWVNESHDVARDVVYPFVPPSLILDMTYYTQVRPVLEDQLLKGGVRLAAVLEKALK